MTTLTDFLLARITEDQAEASNFLRFQVGHRGPGNYSIRDRVIAECEAKRRITESYPQQRRYVEIADTRSENPRVVEAGWDTPTVLHLLALPYASHPEYRDEWRP